MRITRKMVGIDALVVAAALCGAASAQTARIGVASFNAGWWVSQSEFSQVHAQCSSPDRNWCDPRNSAQCVATEKGLPPCNAFVEYHQQTGAAPTPVFVPTLRYWDAKRLALELTLRFTGSDIVGFQEISGEEAARAIFGAAQNDYNYCTSTDRDAKNPEAQRLVIAVRKSAFNISACRTDQSMSVEDVRSPGHFTRPALVTDLKGPGGHRLRVVNVHLKSGCASPAGDSRFDFQGAYLNSTQNPNCPTLRKQVEPLERLIERETAAGGNFVLLGDFNRKLDLELNRKAGDTRVGGENAIGIPASAVEVRLLWPEVNDRDPASSELLLLVREPRAFPCAANEGLDHIAISKRLASANRAVRSREVELTKFAGGLIGASDHCPLSALLDIP